jgi:hypothetical protein
MELRRIVLAFPGAAEPVEVTFDPARAAFALTPPATGEHPRELISLVQWLRRPQFKCPVQPLWWPSAARTVAALGVQGTPTLDNRVSDACEGLLVVAPPLARSGRRLPDLFCDILSLTHPRAPQRTRACAAAAIDRLIDEACASGVPVDVDFLTTLAHCVIQRLPPRERDIENLTQLARTFATQPRWSYEVKNLQLVQGLSCSTPPGFPWRLVLEALLTCRPRVVVELTDTIIASPAFQGLARGLDRADVLLMRASALAATERRGVAECFLAGQLELTAFHTWYVERYAGDLGRAVERIEKDGLVVLKLPEGTSVHDPRRLAERDVPRVVEAAERGAAQGPAARAALLQAALLPFARLLRMEDGPRREPLARAIARGLREGATAAHGREPDGALWAFYDGWLKDRDHEKDVYAAWATGKSRPDDHRAAEREILAEVVELLELTGQEKVSVLDLGGGRGILFDDLSEPLGQRLEYVVFDSSAAAVKQATARGLHAHAGDFNDAAFPAQVAALGPGRFALAAFIQSHQWTRPSRYPAVLGAIGQVLDPTCGALLCLDEYPQTWGSGGAGKNVAEDEPFLYLWPVRASFVIEQARAIGLDLLYRRDAELRTREIEPAAADPTTGGRLDHPTPISALLFGPPALARALTGFTAPAAAAQELTDAVTAVEVISAAAELGVLSGLMAAVGTAELAQRLGLDESALATLLGALAELDIVCRADGKWRLTASGQVISAQPAPGPGVLGLAAAMRSGRPGRGGEAWRATQTVLGQTLTDADVERFATQVTPVLRQLLLEVPHLAKGPQARTVFVGRPAARSEEWLRQRWRGSVSRVSRPDEADAAELIVLGEALADLDDATARAALSSLAQRARPGDVILVIEPVAGGRRKALGARRVNALRAVRSLALGGAGARSQEELVSLLCSSGLVPGEKPIETGLSTLVGVMCTVR